MENNKIKKSVKFQGDMLNFCDFIQVFVFTRNHHLNCQKKPVFASVKKYMSFSSLVKKFTADNITLICFKYAFNSKE